jgi:hypothetical protein
LPRWRGDFATKMENREWRMADAPFHLQSSIIHLRLIIGVTFGWFFFSNGWNEEFVAVKP